MVKLLFPGGAPTLKEYCQESGVASSTFERAAEWLLGLLPGFLLGRRPGPRPAEEAPSRHGREAALRKLEDLRAWLQDKRATTGKNACYTPEAKERIARVAEEIRASGVLRYEEIASCLGIQVRQLHRIRKAVQAAGGAPARKSRRPQRTQTLHPEIQRLIRTIAVSNHKYRPTDVKRILEKNYKKELAKHHGAETISLTTVIKYMKAMHAGETAAPRREHPRGGYDYPEPFQQAAIDTSYFKVFGWTFYIVTVFEMAGRLNLLTRIFLRENAEAVVEVIEQCLCRYPGIGAFVIDRGSPYVNDEVKRLLEERGKLRIVAPPATPTAKAALERHFLTLKGALRRALEAVFGNRDPRWPRRQIATLLEMGAAVFQDMYHRIPQDEIDGQSPAERCENFDPLRAAEKMKRLFERSLDSEPAPDFARRLHGRFQLPGAERETVTRLGRFPTAVLRELLDLVSRYMGPPLPKWMYDPLGYLEAKAREIFEARERRFHAARVAREEEKRRKEKEAAHRETLEAEQRKRQTSPECFVDDTLGGLVKGIQARLPGLVRIFTRQLEALVGSLAKQLGHAFAHEVARLRDKAAALAPNEQVQQELEAVLDGILKRVGVETAPC